MKDYILTIGTSMIDIYGHSPNCQRVTGCNPGSVKISYGGVGRNIVENLLRIDVPTRYISVFGTDAYGIKMKEELESLGGNLNDSLVIDSQSATFMGIIDDKKEIVSAIADSQIMKHLSIEYLKTKDKIISDAQYIVFDSNDYGLFDQFIETYQDKPIIIDPVSPMKAKKIKHLLPFFHTMKPNKKEAEVLCGFSLENEEALKNAGKYFLSLGVKNIFITLGEEGVYFHNGEKEGIIKAKDIIVNNEIGAGDAFVAGICYGYLNELSIEEIVKFAYTMAILSLESIHTVSNEQSLKTVYQRLNQIKWQCSEL